MDSFLASSSFLQSLGGASLDAGLLPPPPPVPVVPMMEHPPPPLAGVGIGREIDTASDWHRIFLPPPCLSGLPEGPVRREARGFAASALGGTGVVGLCRGKLQGILGLS